MIHEGKRDTAATAREESAHACPHSRRELTPLRILQKYPKILSALERNAQVPAKTPHKVLGPEIVGRDEAHFCWGVSRQITPNLWNFQRDLHTLAATQEVPRHTRLHSRGTTRVLPNPEEPRFRLLAREEGSFPCVFGKEFPAFQSHLKRRRSPQERREELQGRATIPRVPQNSQSIPGKPVFPALPRLSSRGSTQTTVARGTALWERLVGKPRGKASWESLEGKPQIP